MATFTLTVGPDNFTGIANEFNTFNFTPTTLSASDTITGIVSASFFDALQLTAGGTVTAAQFAGVTNIELLLLSAAGNNVTLANGLVAGSSAGAFVVIGAAGNDTVNASAVTNGMPIVFSGNGGSDTFVGSSGVNISYFNAGDLTAADTVTGGVGTDTIVIASAGTLAASAFTNVTGIETLYLNTAGNNVTLTNGLVAGSSAGAFVVIGAAGNDAVNASGVTNGMPIVFSGNGGSDTFVGSSGVNISYFDAGDLTAADTVTGGVGTDTIVIASAGTLAASAFTNVTGIETLYLNTAGNNVTLTNGLVAGASAGSFGVVGGAGNDTVDASGVTNGMPIVFSGNGGSDTFVGSSGVNIAYFNASDLTAADTVTGGVGTDTIAIASAGTLAASAFTNVTGIEALYLNTAGNNVTLTNGLVAGASAGSFGVIGAAGNDTVDASGVTNSVSVAFYGNGGTDSFTGHGATDTFVTAAAALGATDVFEGNGGNDGLLVTTNGAIAAASHVGVTEIELVQLQSGGSFQFANNLASASQLVGIGSSAVDSFDGSLVTAYGLVLTGAGGADTMVGGSQDDEFRFPDSSFVQIDGNGGLDRIVLTAPAQVFSLTANAAKITDVEVISLASSAGASLTLAGADIPQINSSGNSLYVVGGADDQVDAGIGWVLISTTHTNAAVAPGVTFAQYHHVVSNAELYVADQIALTIDINDAPTVATSAFAPSFTEDGVPTAVDTGFTVGDVDDTNLESASVSITGGLQAGDVLSFTPQFGIVDTDAAPEVLALSGSATVAQWETVLRSITFSTTSQAPGTSRTVSITVNDGDNNSAAVTKDITVTPVDDAPTAATSAFAPSYTEDGAATAVDTGFTVNDVDDTNLESASVSITGGLQAGDVLGFTPQFGIVDTNAAPEVLALSGSATLAQWETVLRSITFSTTSQAPGTSRTVSITVNDGDTDSAAVAKVITVTPVNDAPTAATSAFPPSYTEDGAPTAVDTGFTVSDVDDTNLESALVSITGGLQVGDVLGFTPQFGIVDTNAAPDILALSGAATLAEWQTVLQSITFSTTSQAPGISRTVSITVNDGDNNSAAVTKDITVASVNDAPAGTDNTVNTTEGTPYTFTAADFGFTDIDGNALFAVRITTLPAAGTLTINGTPVNAGDFIQAADIIAGFLVYTPPAGAGSSFTFQVQDNGGVANGGVDVDQTANTLTILINTPPVANDDTSDATEAGGLNNAVAGIDPTGNVITGVGTGSVTDTDAEDPSTALVVVAVGTGAEGQPDNGTVGAFFSGTYGQLRLMADGSYELPGRPDQRTGAGAAHLRRHADGRVPLHHRGHRRRAGHRHLHHHHPRRQRPAAGHRRHRQHDRGRPRRRASRCAPTTRSIPTAPRPTRSPLPAQ